MVRWLRVTQTERQIDALGLATVTRVVSRTGHSRYLRWWLPGLP
jgi:hypothetical protein